MDFRKLFDFSFKCNSPVSKELARLSYPVSVSSSNSASMLKTKLEDNGLRIPTSRGILILKKLL